MKLRSEGVTWREIDGQSIILDLQSSRYLTTNASGTVLLRRLVRECRQEELSDELVGEFGISPERANADVVAFVSMLRDKDLLDRADTLV